MYPPSQKVRIGMARKITETPEMHDAWKAMQEAEEFPFCVCKRVLTYPALYFDTYFQTRPQEVHLAFLKLFPRWVATVIPAELWAASTADALGRPGIAGPKVNSFCTGAYRFCIPYYLSALTDLADMDAALAELPGDHSALKVHTPQNIEALEM
jgi:hypothetical protein